METLGNLLAPYSDGLAKFAGGVTCLQFLSGGVLLNDIRKIGKSDAYPPEPFLGGLVLTVLCVKLGAVIGDPTMVKVNIIGFAINVVFTVVFYLYASKEFKTKVWSKIGIAGAFIVACLAYSAYEQPEKLEFRFGLLITAILVALVGSPLLNLGDIMKKQSTEGLPFPIILAGTIVASAWTLYGISIKNEVMVYQNLFLAALSAIQLSLFAIYPSSTHQKQSSKSKAASNGANHTIPNANDKKNK